MEGDGGAEQSAARGTSGAGKPEESGAVAARGADAASDEAEKNAKARPSRALARASRAALGISAPKNAWHHTADSAPHALTLLLPALRRRSSKLQRVPRLSSGKRPRRPQRQQSPPQSQRRHRTPHRRTSPPPAPTWRTGWSSTPWSAADARNAGSDTQYKCVSPLLCLLYPVPPLTCLLCLLCLLSNLSVRGQNGARRLEVSARACIA